MTIGRVPPINHGLLIRDCQNIASVSCQDATLSKRLLAGAAACVAVDVKGRALVEVQNDAVMLGQNGECCLKQNETAV
jgi:hypothetical protein